MNFPLADRTIFVTLAGSHAHGTSRPGSDVDVRGVCIVPLENRLSLFGAFEQYEGPLTPELAVLTLPGIQGHETASQCLANAAEATVFDVAKFLRLCGAANPNALEILFADERDWLFERPEWRRVWEVRHRFLTAKVRQTFLGYAMSQLKRIRSHRSWLLHPPEHKPTREEFGLPPTSTTGSDARHQIEQSIAEKIRSYGIEDLEMPRATRIALKERIEALVSDVSGAVDDDLEERLRAVASHALGIPEDVVTTLNAEKRYRAAMRHWDSYQAWKQHRNRARAALERDNGYDTKHAAHLVRLMRMGAEALETGELLVRRPDASELVAIRDGAWDFDALLEAADALQRRIEVAAKSTTLPPNVPDEFVDELALELFRAT